MVNSRPGQGASPLPLSCLNQQTHVKGKQDNWDWAASYDPFLDPPPPQFHQKGTTTINITTRSFSFVCECTCICMPTILLGLDISLRRAGWLYPRRRKVGMGNEFKKICFPCEIIYCQPNIINTRNINNLTCLQRTIKSHTTTVWWNCMCMKVYVGLLSSHSYTDVLVKTQAKICLKDKNIV